MAGYGVSFTLKPGTAPAVIAVFAVIGLVLNALLLLGAAIVVGFGLHIGWNL